MSEPKENKFLTINLNTVATGLVGAGVIWLLSSTNKLQTDLVELRGTLRAKAEQIDKMSTQVDVLQNQMTELRIQFSTIKSTVPK